MTPDEHWALWRADPRATPFQSPAWIEAWWRHIGQGERIDVDARDEGGRLVAALPAFIWNADGVRRLVPLGAGESDYCDALVDAAVPDAPARLWEALQEQADRWDELWLPDLRTGSPLLTALPDGWTANDTPHETCPVLTIPDDGQVLGALTKSQRRKIVHDRHRAEALGGVETRLAAPHEIDEALDALFRLHAERWQAEGQAGVLAAPRIQAFHRAAAPALAAAGLLRLAVVRWEGRIVAVLLGFSDGRRGYSYINGTAFTPGQSFGTLAFACLIEGAAAEGAREFHFLRGEEPYKYGWGSRPTQTTRRVVRRG
jgi:CelD/BcsL family acetyltransferase involved in cellulose biosynthesis